MAELEANMQATLNDRTDLDSVAASSTFNDDGELLSPESQSVIIKEETIG